MAYQSIFKGGPCQVFVRFYTDGDPPGSALMVNIDDLSPDVGVCTVNEETGDVTCDFVGDLAGSTGFYPTIIVVPNYDTTGILGVRASQIEYTGDGGTPSNTETYLGGYSSIIEEVPGQYNFGDTEMPYGPVDANLQAIVAAPFPALPPTDYGVGLFLQYFSPGV